MQKLYFFLFVCSLASTISSAQIYSYDFNPNTKIARLYTNNEIILEYDVSQESAFLADYKFSNGYILTKNNDNWIETGFYNSKEIIYNKTAYQLKTNLIGRVLIKKENDKKWIKVKVTKNKINFQSNSVDLPEAVQYVVLAENLKNKCLEELEFLRKKRENEYLDRLKELKS